MQYLMLILIDHEVPAVRGHSMLAPAHIIRASLKIMITLSLSDRTQTKAQIPVLWNKDI